MSLNVRYYGVRDPLKTATIALECIARFEPMELDAPLGLKHVAGFEQVQKVARDTLVKLKEHDG